MVTSALPWTRRAQIEPGLWDEHWARPASKSIAKPIHSRRIEAAYNKAWRLSGRPFRQMMRAHPCLPRRERLFTPQTHKPTARTSAPLPCGGHTTGATTRSPCVAVLTDRFAPCTFGFAPAFELSRFAIGTLSQYQSSKWAWEWERDGGSATLPATIAGKGSDC